MREERLTLKKMGEEVARLREAQGLSRKDVAESLHIREQFIEAIENGAEERFPAPVYIRGFIRNYLEFLGASQLWESFAAEVPLEHPRASDTADAMACPPVSPGFHRLSRSWIYLMVIGLACTTAFFVWKEWDLLRAQIGQGGRADVPSAESPSVVLPVFSPTPAPRAVALSSDPGKTLMSPEKLPGAVLLSGEKLSLDRARSADTASEDFPWLQEMAQITRSRDAEGKNLVLLASDSCWVRIAQVEKVFFEGIMKSGEERRIPLTAPVRVRMGKSSAITATWGGQTRSMGKGTGGGVITVTFSPDGTMTPK